MVDIHFQGRPFPAGQSWQAEEKVLHTIDFFIGNLAIDPGSCDDELPQRKDETDLRHTRLPYKGNYTSPVSLC